MELYQEALEKFIDLLEEARRRASGDPMTMTLATADNEGRPSIRTMSLKGVDQDGFVFFTNTNSRKGRQLLGNPYGAICFYWQSLSVQVKADGPVLQIDDTAADEYWATRDRESQLVSWASCQSELLESQQSLRDRYAEYKVKFNELLVPRPSDWSGLRLVPERVEFWDAGWHRLHNGLRYEKTGDQWKKYLINP